jgi:SPP1 family predicted phage head-tail adaptor
MQINPGIFNKKIEIIRYILTKDSDGFDVKTEEIMLKTWAQVTNTSGTELIRADSDFAETKTRFFMRTPKLIIDKDYKIKFSEKIYEIIYVNDYSYDKNYTEVLTMLVEK